MKISLPFLLLLLLLMSSAVFAAEPAEMINRTTCTKSGDTRELEIVAKGDGHRVSYTKNGKTSDVGACALNKEKCQAIFDQIKASLEKTGYACKI